MQLALRIELFHFLLLSIQKWLLVQTWTSLVTFRLATSTNLVSWTWSVVARLLVLIGLRLPISWKLIAAFLFERKMCARNVLRICRSRNVCHDIMRQAFGVLLTSSHARLFIYLTVSAGLFPKNLASSKGLLASCWWWSRHSFARRCNLLVTLFFLALETLLNVICGNIWNFSPSRLGLRCGCVVEKPDWAKTIILRISYSSGIVLIEILNVQLSSAIAVFRQRGVLQ